MKRRCERCQALIVFEPSGYIFHAEEETAERIWWKDCPFCGKENSYWEEMS